MSILAVGSIAFDSITVAFRRVENVPGGSAPFFPRRQLFHGGSHRRRGGR